ncbi:MAG TPA: hypothetical protein VFW83_00085, partial [Bryobacteraceae bacterium]|nr:hypothetical protein [Bryobacteraceae bacterium]
MLAAVLEISCSRSSNPSSKIERLSILRFDNLTGDPSFDWLTTAAPGMLIDQLTGSGQILPSLADSVSGAYIEQATRMGHGYFEKRAGKLHFAVLIEDSENHKIVQRDTADGPPLAAMGALAKQLDPRARAFSTSNPEAAAAWGRGEFEQAAGLDPDFGLAWLAWAQKLAAGGDSGRAEEVAQRALMRPGLRSVIERTRLELLLSSLRGDAQGRVHALQELARLIPADPSNLRALAEAEMNARNFSEAAREYRELIQSGTGAADAGLENALGYAEAFAGNLEAAKKAFAEYGREPGQAVNALDSLGEGLFVNGKFAEAEKAFLEAYSKDS